MTGESVDQEFPTRMVLCGSDKGEVTTDRGVRGSDEELGEIRVFISFAVEFLCRVVLEGDIDNDGGVLGLKNQELRGSVVSDNDIISGLDFTTLDDQALYLAVSYPSHETARKNLEPVIR